MSEYQDGEGLPDDEENDREGEIVLGEDGKNYMLCRHSQSTGEHLEVCRECNHNQIRVVLYARLCE